MGGIAALALSLCLTACSDDDGPSYSKTVLQNTELKTILTQKGYQFNEDGNLLLDDMANKTTSLDLSGTGISVDALSELSILPNLTDVDLSDNGYTKSFDFTKLPAQIIGVDLTGNVLYDFPGLLNIVTQENGDEDVTVLRNLTKLYLPESAKYNCDEIPTYFAKVSGVDMQMENASGTLETYTTLREIPDASFRSNLKSLFPSLFNGDKIDISKRLVNPTEVSQSLTTINMTERTMAVDDIEGFQYIMLNKGYTGAFVSLYANEDCSVSYFPVSSTISQMILSNISTPNGLDLSEAKNLSYLDMTYNKSITSIDFSSSTALGQRGDEAESGSFPDFISICSCESLAEAIFPQNAKVMDYMEFTNCPSMKKLDLSCFETMNTLALGLNTSSCELAYPSFTRTLSGGRMWFAIDELTYNIDATKTFIENNKDNLKYTRVTSGHGVSSYRWDRQ